MLIHIKAYDAKKKTYSNYFRTNDDRIPYKMCPPCIHFPRYFQMLCDILLSFYPTYETSVKCEMY